jgi:hypothetical protein
MRAVTENAGKVWTEAELQAMPDDGYVRELVDGQLVMSPRTSSMAKSAPGFV